MLMLQELLLRLERLYLKVGKTSLQDRTSLTLGLDGFYSKGGKGFTLRLGKLYPKAGKLYPKVGKALL